MKRIFLTLGVLSALAIAGSAMAQDRDWNHQYSGNHENSHHNRMSTSNHRHNRDVRTVWRTDPDQWRSHVSSREWRSFGTWRRHRHHSGDWHSDFSVWINLHPSW
jgi:Flp pilus assembly protein TadB